MKRYSIFSLARNAFNYHKDWQRAWRSPEPKSEYDVVIIGAGGHGLATAYYLAKEHGVTNVAVLEKGWLGGGNTGRNTTIIRSNYLQDESMAIYELARSLYEDLAQDVNFNVMFSPRGLLMLCQTEHELRAMKRTDHANRLAGIEARMISPAEVKTLVPIVNDAPDCRYPILGAYYQPRGGTGRHDAVAWGYARAADARGVDIVQNCEVFKILREGDRVQGVETSRGTIRAKKVAVVTSGNTSVIMETAGLRMPMESVCLQAMVSEPIKPCMDVVVMANTVHGYMSQSDKGELVIGGGADPYNNYSQRGSFPALEHTVTALVETFPIISRLRMLRMWGGVVDMTGDRSPIISKTDVGGLYVNAGWGTGGFKSIPGSGFVFADTVANDRPHPIAEPFGLNRFMEGRLIDESVAAAVAH
ncbi:sarcosine oxidase subunit beta family protein [Kaustia mangrovi]|uniref:Sarcosine oxidase subunit beta n=1 Tax=Kaustia mangrovi TaxID=2593653 RepID=A0A7S8C248_9HYPH|nr:sarcosine oxidase subunit beta family protein [Kaustia mangrovi]QPC41975.1 sarcosine oxidase subunit beta family protein [Kaustia mangrovi]